MFSRNKIAFKYFQRLFPSIQKKDYCNVTKHNFKNVQNVKPIYYGQPTHETHPYLLNPGEVVPGIQLTEFKTRREFLVQTIFRYTTEHDKTLENHKHVVVIPSAEKKYMSDKIPYFFRQNSDFLYLSGCLEPESCLVIEIQNGSFKSTIFIRPKDSHSELWDGPRTGTEHAPTLFGVDQSFPINTLGHYLTTLFQVPEKIILWYDFNNNIQKSVDSDVRTSFSTMPKKHWESPTSVIHRLRLIKSQSECDLMRKTCEIASQAISKTIATSKPGWTEQKIFATVDYECRMNGAEYLAYPPVVAGGNRANIIHYINNNQIVNDREMVLMDAGCEYHGYTSDITRTWPINGHFTDPQRVLYEIILDIQKTLISKCDRTMTLDNLFDLMCILLGERLQEVGIISKKLTKEEAKKLAFKYCPHHVSHYLGMDVHDTPSINRSVKLIPGMIVTVEPGIYLNEKSQVPDEFKGIGIRIEDNILITENGPEVLTINCPKEVRDIEKISQIKSML